MAHMLVRPRPAGRAVAQWPGRGRNGPRAFVGVVKDRLPIVYVRGYAGPTASLDVAVDDPFYGFNSGATHVRVGGRRRRRERPRGVVVDLPVLRRGCDHIRAAPARKRDRRLLRRAHQAVTADGFDIEKAAAGLYDLIALIRLKTGAPRVHLGAHSMVVRCRMQKICFLRIPLAMSGRRPGNWWRSFSPTGPRTAGSRFSLMRWTGPSRRSGRPGPTFSHRRRCMATFTRRLLLVTFLHPGRRDPQAIPASVFAAGDVFCLIGTDPKDYGLSRVVVGPKSDGLVLIEHAYLRGAHRAYVYKSHSGTYGEVNSEVGYQNLRRFLFGRWQVGVGLAGSPPTPPPTTSHGRYGRADMRLAIRGLPVVISEQLAAQVPDPVGRGDPATGRHSRPAGAARQHVHAGHGGCCSRPAIPQR